MKNEFVLSSAISPSVETRLTEKRISFGTKITPKGVKSEDIVHCLNNARAAFAKFLTMYGRHII